MATDSAFVNGAQRLGQRIATIRARLALPVMTAEIGRLLLDRTMRRFDAQTDPDGNRWRALSPLTLRSRNRQGFPDVPILFRTGTLRNAIQIIRGKVSSGAEYINTGAGLRIGVTRQNANYVQTTSSRSVNVADVARYMNKGTRTVPKRRFLGVGRLDVKAVDSLLRRRGAELMR